jgi:hypothetical protein
MPRSAAFCVTLLALVVAINIKLGNCADNAAQNITTVSELYSELSVVSDNICNHHEKNVAFDVIVVDSSSSSSRATAVNDVKRFSKRHAGDKRRDFKDRPRADQKSLLLVFDGTGVKCIDAPKYGHYYFLHISRFNARRPAAAEIGSGRDHK